MEKRGEKLSASAGLGLGLAAIVIGVLWIWAVICAVQATVAPSGFTLSVIPGTNTPGAITHYTFSAENPDGYTGDVDIVGTIPAGYHAVPPTSGWQRVATANLYNGSFLLGKVTMESNSTDPSGKVDIVATAYFDGSATQTGTKDVDYSPGATTSVGPLTVDGLTFQGSITLPTDTADGTITAEIELPPGIKLTKVVITTGDFVQNPPAEGDYTFSLSVNGEQREVPVPISRAPPTAVPALTPSGMLALVGILGIIIALATREGGRRG